MVTQRRNVSRSKSKSSSNSNKGSNSRKHLIKSRKSGTKTRKMRGGAFKEPRPRGKWGQPESGSGSGSGSGSWVKKETPPPVAPHVTQFQPVRGFQPPEKRELSVDIEKRMREKLQALKPQVSVEDMIQKSREMQQAKALFDLERAGQRPEMEAYRSELYRKAKKPKYTTVVVNGTRYLELDRSSQKKANNLVKQRYPSFNFENYR